MRGDHRALVRLEWVERIGRELGVGRDTLRSTFGRMLIPGIPKPQDEFDGVGLLNLPAGDTHPSIRSRCVRSSGST